MTDITIYRRLLAAAILPLAFAAQTTQAQFMIDDSAPVERTVPVANDANPQPSSAGADVPTPPKMDLADESLRAVVGRVVGGKRAGQVAAVEAVARKALDGDGDVAAIAADTVGAGDIVPVARELLQKLGKAKPR